MRRIYLFVILLSFIFTVPLWVVWFLPIQDYYNILARAYILNHLQDIPYFSKIFELTIPSMPDVHIISDLLISFFHRFVGIETAGKMFLSTIVLLIPISFLFCLSAVNAGKEKQAKLPAEKLLTSLMVFPLLYQHNFNMGNTNYLFSVGIFLLALGCFLRKKFVATLILSAVMFISHLFSFALFCFIILYLIYTRRGQKNMINAFTLITVSLYLILTRFYTSLFNMKIMKFDSLMERVQYMLGTFYSYNALTDSIVATLLLAVILYLLYCGSIIKEAKLWGDISVILFLLMILSPRDVLPLFNIPERFKYYFVFFLLLTISASIFSLHRKEKQLLILAIILSMVVSLTSTFYNYKKLDKELTNQHMILSGLPPAKAIYNTSYNAAVGNVNPFEHFASNYVILKGGFTSSIFVGGLIKLKTEFQKVAWSSPSMEHLKSLNLIQAYDFVYLINAPEDIRKGLLQMGYILKYNKGNISIYEAKLKQRITGTI